MVYKGESTKDGRCYYFRIKYKDLFGKKVDYKSMKFKTKKEATDEEALYRVKISENKSHTKNHTFNELFTEYLEEQSKVLKKQSIEKIKQEYSKFPLGELKVNDFNVNTFKKFKTELESLNLSTTYSNKVIGVIKNLIKHSAKYYNTSDDVLKFMDKIKRQEFHKEMDFFTYDEFQSFIKVIDEPIYKVFFETLFYLGLRQGEAQALQVSDIDFQKKELSISKTLTTKIKRELYTITTPKTPNSNRKLPIPDKLLTEYKTLLNGRIKGFLFGNELPLRETTITAKKNKYCDLAGLKRIRIHDFRHSCASFLINNGASIVLVSKYLGHAKVSITLDVYSHLYKNELEEITKMFEKCAF